MPLAAQDKTDLMLRAFADRTRLRILSLLTKREEICVCDLMRVLKLPQAKVSRHLAYLRSAGLVVGRKQQQWMHYRLKPVTGATHRKLLECVACCGEELSSLKKDHERLGSCCEVSGESCCP